MKKILLAVTLSVVLPFASAARIVTLTSDVADVVVALGSANEVVGRDVSATNPALKNVPSIGLFHGLSVEPIAAKKPTIVLGSWMAQPSTIYANLKRVGINAVNVEPNNSIESYANGIRQIGKLIGKSAQDETLAKIWPSQVKQLTKTGKRYLIS